jgi:CheY-like chemotaxis protein
MNNKKILIADDSLIVLKALELKLKAAGYKTTTATDGSDALEKAAQVHPDLVIMDINFPPDISQGGVVWDGFRIIEWMRHTGSTGTAPFIIITSDEIEKHRGRALAAGAVAVFQKPISLPHLLATINECFQESPQLH